MSTKQKKYKYKVVTKTKRISAIATDHYCQLYTPGKEVHAMKNTYGIFVFETKKQATNWLNIIKSPNDSLFKIIRVIPIGKKSIPNNVSKYISCGSIDQFYQYKKKHIKQPMYEIIPPPEGTMTYPAVYVVD